MRARGRQRQEFWIFYLGLTKQPEQRKRLIVDKNFVSFLLLAAVILVSSRLVTVWLNPQPEVANNPEAAVVQPDDDRPDGGQPVGNQPDDANQANDNPADDVQAEVNAGDPIEQKGQDEIDTPPVAPGQTWTTVGSLARTSPYKMAVWFNSRGGTIECVALNDGWYDLYDRSGYLGYLALSDEGGCRVNAVADGTPAALAKSATPAIQGGIQAGDIITRLNGAEVANKEQLRDELKKTRFGQTAEVVVRRAGKEITFSVNLVRRPLEVIRPERQFDDKAVSPTNPLHPLSYLTSLSRLGDRTLQFGETELKGLPSLRDENWAVKEIDDAKGPGVEFSFVIPADTAPELEDDLIIYKRYRLARDPKTEKEGNEPRLYHLTLELEFVYKGDKPLPLAYQQAGPTGLPLEGWWYTFKTHPRSFGGAGRSRHRRACL